MRDSRRGNAPLVATNSILESLSLLFFKVTFKSLQPDPCNRLHRVDESDSIRREAAETSIPIGTSTIERAEHLRVEVESNSCEAQQVEWFPTK